MKTKIVGSAGRFGARYGLKLRSRIAKVEKEQKAPQECPYCLRKGVKRLAAGIWQCPKCSEKFTGSAYRVKPVMVEERR